MFVPIISLQSSTVFLSSRSKSLCTQEASQLKTVIKSVPTSKASFKSFSWQLLHFYNVGNDSYERSIFLEEKPFYTALFTDIIFFLLRIKIGMG